MNKQEHPPTPTIQEQLEAFIEQWVRIEAKDAPVVKEAKLAARKEFVAKATLLITKAKMDAVQELKRRWNEDRTTMDYSPDTYMFICDKFLAELATTQNTKETT